MRNRNRWQAVILLILAALLLAACGTKSASTSSTSSNVQAARIEEIDNSELHRLILSEKAAQRLDIHTAPVREEQVNGTQRKVVPYAALVYDVNGDTLVFTAPEPLTFVRQLITLDYIEGDMAVLVEGPPLGTEVVTVGVSELFGLETGVGK